MTDALILIASSSLDEPAWRNVANNLRGQRLATWIFQADRVARGEEQLCIDLGGDEIAVRYAGEVIDYRRVASAWYRRPTMFSGELDDKARQLTLDTERRVLQYGLWDLIDSQVWLTAPRDLLHAEHKLVQLRAARDVGFQIPHTLVTNDWDCIDEKLPSDIIFKPSFGNLYGQDGLKLAYTTRLKNQPAALPTAGNPFPGLWQPFVPKAREWRVTVVDEQIFAAAIYTTDEAKDDWRRHQLTTDHVVFRAEPLPASTQDLCLRYMRKLRLGFGAFDLIERPDGAIIFLECNANGQFGWLEDELGFAISTALADALRLRVMTQT